MIKVGYKNRSYANLWLMLLTAGRHITHMDLDTFFVSVEYLRNSKLKGKPVLIGGMSDRAVVASCGY
jgi:DNA polymerase-4